MTAPASNQIHASESTASGMTRCAKILEIGPYPPPYDGWSMRIWVVKNGLEKAGHICVPLNLGQNRRIRSAEYECVRSGWEYLRKLSRYAWRGYTYHIHTNADSLKGFLLNLIAYVVSLLAFRRPVLTLHAGTDQVYFPREKSRLMVPLFKFLFGAAKAVICDNPDVARGIVDYGTPPEKVFPISPFTKEYLESPTQAFDNDLEEFLMSHSPTVLTYLECRPEYDLDCVFKVVGELARRWPGLGLIVVGASRETRTISDMARKAGLTDRCLHLGAVEHAAFLSLLRRVAVYLRCNQREGTSASVREALCFGTPVVANNSESQPEGVLLYLWGDARAMRETVETVLANSHTRQEPGNGVGALDVPDTVPQEVGLLVRCALA